ncbi:MAG: hypothetical protein IT585_12220 [candidate division Zixibacteria bacterium]|nr:hypothetical protein [candidate division Zixibacteria bacterium]
MNSVQVWQTIKDDVSREIGAFLKHQFDSGSVDQLIYEKAVSDVGVFANLCKWMESPAIDRISPNTKPGILAAIFAQRWPDVNEAFFTDVEFGTGGIRGRAVISDWELEMLRDVGIDAPFLRGPNTINDVVLLQKSAAIAKFANMRGFKSLVIGFDSRIRGRDFAKIIAELFIDFGLKVYLFDDVVPYPEVTFAIPTMHADMGILLSASHNDRRYNGYKLSCGNGSQFSVAERRMILSEYIGKTGFDEIRRADLARATNEQLTFLGGAKRVKGINYYNYQGEPVNVHKQHEKQIMSFLLDKKLLAAQAKKLNLGFCAYNGAGRDAVPRLIHSLKIDKLDLISVMQPVDGMFPAFDDLKSPKGKKVYQQPDPGDKFAAMKAVTEYIKEFGAEKFAKLDALIGTDPDADRVGVVVPVPKSQRAIYGSDSTLLDADTAWAILLWYRMEKMKQAKGDFSRYFLVQSHTTTDVITLLCEKYGIAWIKTWVGFAQLSAAVERVWKNDEISKKIYWTLYDFKGLTPQATVNLAALEQSNGFSILGAKPRDEMSMGTDGHVRDKDGIFAAMLFLEVLAYAKAQKKSVLDLVNEKLYLDPAIGLIRTGYRPAPVYGQYEGIEGRSTKMKVIHKAEGLMERLAGGGAVKFGGLKATHFEVYKTGKYDIQHGYTKGYNPDDPSTFGFPDEGIRFFFGDYYSHLTIRPSGTSQSLRFHIQLREKKVSKGDLLKKRIAMERKITSIFEDVGKQLDVDWDE